MQIWCGFEDNFTLILYRSYYESQVLYSEGVVEEVIDYYKVTAPISPGNYIVWGGIDVKVSIDPGGSNDEAISDFDYRNNGFRVVLMKIPSTPTPTPTITSIPTIAPIKKSQDEVIVETQDPF